MNLQFVYRYVLSLSKSENMFYIKTNNNKKKTKGPKKGVGGEVSNGESRTPDLQSVSSTRYLLLQDN